MFQEEYDIQEIAEQLSCPTGEYGRQMGDLLHSSNKDMIYQSILELGLEDNKRVLELGHGNCSHLSFLLKRAVHLRYFGMEISEIMKQEAERINTFPIKKGEALFLLFDGLKIPYVVNFFDYIMSVNTIYFWEKPKAFLKEAYRVLKPKGTFVLTFVHKASMENLPFVSETHLFELYDQEKLKNLVRETDFTIAEIIKKEEQVKSKTGELVNREYSIVVLKK